jgi:hypothetical protein
MVCEWRLTVISFFLFLNVLIEGSTFLGGAGTTTTGGVKNGHTTTAV